MKRRCRRCHFLPFVASEGGSLGLALTSLAGRHVAPRSDRQSTWYGDEKKGDGKGRRVSCCSVVRHHDVGFVAPNEVPKVAKKEALVL